MRGTPLVPGAASGDLLVLGEPLSFWGGFNSATGVIIDRRHPQIGVALGGRVVLMAGGRGSSSASSVLAEAIRLGTAPSAILLGEADEIMVLGAVVAEELYATTMPILLLDSNAYSEAGSAGTAETTVSVHPDGQIVMTQRPG